MSLCSQSLRALLRSGVSPSRTLLPFLYQTATIQQRAPATRPIARRHVSSRTKREDRISRQGTEDEIPFENAEAIFPPTAGEAHRGKKTTITDTEREAFEKLYKTFNTQGQGKAGGKGGEHEELDQIADEYYEDDEEGSSNSLNEVFATALRGSQRHPNVQNPTADADTAQNKKKLAAKAEKERIRKLRLDERERVDNLLKAAQTDAQLWNILDCEVFDKLRKLDLDGTNTSKKRSSKPNNVAETKTKTTSTSTSTVDTRILFPNYPRHLAMAVQILRVHFPTSPLSLAILPKIKSLGRSSYALGATTQLYTHLLRTAWLQQSSYTLMDTLLTDMETNMVEFDLKILELLEAVIREHEEAMSGILGRELQMVHGMEMWVQGIGKIRTWWGVVAERLGVQDRRPVRARVERNRREDERGSPDAPRFNGMAQGDAIPFVGENISGTTPFEKERKEETALEHAGNLQEKLNSDEEDVPPQAKVLL